MKISSLPLFSKTVTCACVIENCAINPNNLIKSGIAFSWWESHHPPVYLYLVHNTLFEILILCVTHFFINAINDFNYNFLHYFIGRVNPEILGSMDFVDFYPINDFAVVYITEADLISGTYKRNLAKLKKVILDFIFILKKVYYSTYLKLGMEWIFGYYSICANSSLLLNNEKILPNKFRIFLLNPFFFSLSKPNWLFFAAFILRIFILTCTKHKLFRY